jgi:hypothetical protein
MPTAKKKPANLDLEGIRDVELQNEERTTIYHPNLALKEQDTSWDTDFDSFRFTYGSYCDTMGTYDWVGQFTSRVSRLDMGSASPYGDKSKVQSYNF